MQGLKNDSINSMKDISGESKDNIRIHLACNNMFFSLSFSFYLREYLSNINEADFVITDNLRAKTHLPICVIGRDLIMPCSVYEMFSQLHDFYSKINIQRAQAFQKDIRYANNKKEDSKFQSLGQNSPSYTSGMRNLGDFNHKRIDQDAKEQDVEHQDSQIIIESMKEQKMQETIKNLNPALKEQVETLFDELSKKIYDTLNKKGQ